MKNLKDQIRSKMQADLVERGITPTGIKKGFKIKKGRKIPIENPFPIGTRAVYVFLSKPNGKISAAALEKMCVFFGIEV